MSNNGKKVVEEKIISAENSVNLPKKVTLEQQQPPYPPYYEDDEITLKELILKIQEFWGELWRNKFWIVGTAVLAAGLWLSKAMFVDKTTYRSTLSFMVDEENGKNGSPVADLLGYSNFNYNFERITELAKSAKIVNNTLLSEVK
ncbi:MAG: Wzz/FepE/Etk N-terminal domain-containing protein, partial [Bacteroidota bacterium]